MNHSEQLNDLAGALAKAQAKFSSIPKTSTNPFFKSKYAGLPEVVEAASPIITDLGLSISQFLGIDEAGHDTLTTWLLHSSGQYIAQTMRLHLNKDDAQSQGSATTYARRYSYMAVLGLVADEDDDGNAASKSPAQKPASIPYKAPTAVPAPEPVNKTDYGKPGLIKPQSMDALKAKLTAKGQTGTKAVEFSRFIIGKDKPENEDEVNQLIEALS